MSDQPTDNIARRTLRRLDKSIDWLADVQRLPDETDAAYFARLETIARESNGMVSLIIIHEIAQRQSPLDNEASPPHDFTPLSRRVIPIVNRLDSKH